MTNEINIKKKKEFAKKKIFTKTCKNFATNKNVQLNNSSFDLIKRFIKICIVVITLWCIY